MGIVVLCGHSGSGKTVVRDALIKSGFSPIVTYTTRPKRKGEINGKSYHFISNDEFQRMVENDLFAEHKNYSVSDGSTWKYGSAKDSLMSNEDSVIIITPQGYRDIYAMLPDNHICIYLYANRKTILHRLEKRGDSKEEIERRMKKDDEDFKGFQYEYNVKIVYNDEDVKLSSVVDKIKHLFEEVNK